MVKALVRDDLVQIKGFCERLRFSRIRRQI